MSYVLSRGLWEIARPHMEALVARTRESTSIAQLDGSDIVYVARVAVPKIVTLSVTIGTRFPAMQTSLGKVLLAALPPAEAERVLAEPSRSGITPRWQPDAAERAAALREVRARGWALTDEQLAPGIRSVAVPLRDGDGRVIAAINVNSHAAETPLDVLIGQHLPLLLQTAGSISADWAARQSAPQVTVVPGGTAGGGPCLPPSRLDRSTIRQDTRQSDGCPICGQRPDGRAYGELMRKRHERCGHGAARSAFRAARCRLLPGSRRAVLHDAARRPRRERHQGGVARRR